jgi:photosystem II stability/assembly factor-like uncharacterized protein
MTTPQSDLVRLVFILKDEQGQPIAARTRIVVKKAPPDSDPRTYSAESEEGEVTHFTLQLEPGTYSVEVKAEGFQDYQQLFSVSYDREEALVVLVLPAEDPNEDARERGEGTRIVDRLAWFVEQRTYPGTIFPSGGRERALEQEKHMNDPDVTNAGLGIEAIENPLPNSSFGSIGRYIRVDAQDQEGAFRRALLKIPYTEEDLGWVDPASLRIFEVDTEARTFHLIKDSGVNTQRGYSYAYIERPGIYGVIGLPQDPDVLQTVRTFCELQSQVLEKQRRGNHALQERICQLILCPPNIVGEHEGEREAQAQPSSACDVCRTITLPTNGLPECQLLSIPFALMVLQPDCNWTSIGPRNINGRVRALAVHPTDSNTIYAGTANAGVWVTSDTGSPWRPLMLDEDALEIGALAVHLNADGNVTIYAGTGEPILPQGLITGISTMPFYKGIGILKSTNSGAKWTELQLPPPGNDCFSTIVIDTSNTAAEPIVYAGGSPGGLYKSSDGGATWELTLSKTTTGCALDPTNPAVTGLALDPTNPAVVYAAVSNKGICKYDPATGWNPFNTGFTSFPQLILIAIGQSEPHTMYAKLDQTVYKYDVTDAIWKSLGEHGGDTGTHFWSNVLGVDPKDSSIVFVGGTYIESSFDGGKNWQIVGSSGGSLPAGPLHADQHALVFNSHNHEAPTNDLKVYVANDGGVWRGTYKQTGTGDWTAGDWTNVSNGLVLTQFNQVGVDAKNPGIMGGGTQDNGTLRTVGGLTWDTLLGGDGGYFIIDPDDTQILYVEQNQGDIWRRATSSAPFLHRNGFQAETQFPGGPWVTPIALDPKLSPGNSSNTGTTPSPTISPKNNRVLFAGGIRKEKDSAGHIVREENLVYRTTNSGANWSSVSPDLGGAILTIAIAPATSAIVYAGTSTGRVWRSSDNGDHWQDSTVTSSGSAILPSRSIKHIVVHPNDANTVYLAFSGFEVEDPPASPLPPPPPPYKHVFRGQIKDQGGSLTWTWEDISSNLPDIPTNAIVVDPSRPDNLYIATDIGVYYTTHGGLSWDRLGVGLPHIVVSDLAINSAGDLLRAATYGNGMYELHLGPTCLDVALYMRDNKPDIGQTFPSPSGLADPTKVNASVSWWESADIKINVSLDGTVPLDGVEFDRAASEGIILNDAAHPNRLYVQVHNRGPSSAHEVKVKVLWTEASAGLPPLPANFWSSYPQDWSGSDTTGSDTTSAWHTVDQRVPYQEIDELPPATPKILQWHWDVPPKDPCILAVISAKEDPVTRNDGVPDDHLLGNIVPNDKHIALSNVHVVTASPPTSGLLSPLKASLNFHNPFPYPQFFDIIVDKCSSPKGSWLKLLLPEDLLDLPTAVGRTKGQVVSEITGNEPWWDQFKDLLKEEWRYACHMIMDDDDEDDGQRDVVRIPRVLIPAKRALRTTLLIAPPPNVKPGSTYRFTVMQGLGETIVGGSTYEVRIPVTETPLYEC